MSRYCLDTSAYSQFKRGQTRVVELLDQAQWVGVPAATLGELWVGFLLSARREENIAEFGEFLAHPAVHGIPAQREISRIYAEIVIALRREGSPLPSNDIWIAASAAHTGATVLTFDAHFEKIQRVGSIVLSP